MCQVFIPALSPFWVGTLGMLMLAFGLIVFIIFHQRKVIRYQKTMQEMEAEQQKVLLTASIKLQEEERQRIAADLHDDAGPLLATARLYLSENIIDDDRETQRQTILSTKEIIDDTIQLVRNISHSLMPPTLKNFGLESAVKDFFQKLDGAGVLNVNCTFTDYAVRLKPEAELMAFRIVQELVNNILKHSHSSFIQLTQQSNNGHVLLNMKHDGEGLTQEEFINLAKRKGGLGLKNIQSRLKMVDGTINFERDVSTAYQVTISIPRESAEK